MSNIGSSLGQSVVPDLMRVYESLTQSSTPQHPLPQHRAHPGQNSKQFQYSHQSSTHTTSAAPQSQYKYSTNHYNKSHNQQPAQSEVAPLAHNSHQQSVQRQPSGVQYQPQHLSSGYAQPVVSSTAHPHIQSQDSNYYQPQTANSPSTGNNEIRSSRKRSSESDKSNSDNESNKLSRKKGGGNDGRWSKRFAWPDELHRDFVSAVFDVGLKHSSPSAILEQMPKHDQITSERIKSHLQKYRLHRQKSKKEFMGSYDSTISKLQAGTMDTDPKSMNSGEVAAHLSFTALTEVEIAEANSDAGVLVQGGALQLPQLTEEEKRSPVGASMGYLMGLFFSLKQQLIQQRSGRSVGEHPATALSAAAHFVPPKPPPSIHSSYHQNGVPQSTVCAPYNGGGPKVSEHRQNHNYPSHAVHDQILAPGPSPQAMTEISPPPMQAPEPQQNNWTNSECANAPYHHQGNDMKQDHQPQESQHASEPSSSGTLIMEETSTSRSSAVMPPPNPRNNVPLEESNIMKREMQNQMVFQNKMRKLKEQEISKYTSTGFAKSSSDGSQDKDTSPSVKWSESDASTGAISDSKIPDADIPAPTPVNGSQGASEEATNGSEAPKDESDDFWQTDVVDEQLFEFLMDN